MKELNPDTPFKATLLKAWQVIAGVVTITATVTTVYLTRENQRDIQEQEFRHQLLNNMRTFVTYTSLNDWIDALERKNPSLVLPRIRQAALEERPNKYQAALKGNSDNWNITR